MHLHSTLDGRAVGFRLRGAAWESDSLAFRGFLYLIPTQDGGNGRHRVVEAEGESLWNLLDALREQVILISGAAVNRLDAHVIGSEKSTTGRSANRARVPNQPRPEFETA